MNKTTTVALILVLTGAFQTSNAAESALTKQFSTCMDKTGGVTAAMLDCIGSEAKRQDARLNKAYKDAMPTLAPARQKQLQEVQRIWIAYRDANCRFYADPDGGTMATVAANDCIMSTTAARATELEGFKQ